MDLFLHVNQQCLRGLGLGAGASVLSGVLLPMAQSLPLLQDPHTAVSHPFLGMAQSLHYHTCPALENT